MAQTQKLGLRACSFSFRIKRSRLPDKVFKLDSKISLTEFENEIVSFKNAIDLITDFIESNKSALDIESSNQIFYCNSNPENSGETDKYYYQIFSVYAGYYGYASELVNRETKNVVHEKSRDEADVKQFYLTIAIPKSTELQDTKRGLILFQEIGIYGVKTITSKRIQEYMSNKYNLSFDIQNLAPDFYLKRLFSNGEIKKIKLARNTVSTDSADKMYGAGIGREERALVPFKVTKRMKADLKHVSEGKFNYYSFDGIDYPEVKMVIEIGGRVRTIDLHGLDELSIEEALPDELLLADGTIDFPKFREHIHIVIDEYIEHIPNSF